MSIKIVIDPGHGRYGNPGVIKPYYEGTRMYKLAGYLKAELEKYGARVIVTRNNVTDDPVLAARGKMAKGYDLFISLHSNAPGEAAKKDGTYNTIRGTSVYDTVTRPNKGLADAIGQAVSSAMGHRYGGTNYRKGKTGADYYGVLRNAIAVGCKSAMLIEHGYHTNPDDCRFLLDDNNLKRIAQAEATVIAKHYGLIKGDDIVAVLKRGSKGAAVTKLQKDLIMLGYSVGASGADGNFGPATENAVKAFQRVNGLKVDGLVGPATIGKIESLLKVPAQPVVDYKKLYEDLLKKVNEAKRILG